MTKGQAVRKYQVAATFSNDVVEWSFAIQTEDAQEHVLKVRDGEEIPTLVDLCRRDLSIYYDPQTRTLRSGWNAPGRTDELK